VIGDRLPIADYRSPTTGHRSPAANGSRASSTCSLLQPVKQKGGKIVHAWACEGDCDPATIRSTAFTMEWPPRSGQQQAFPEIDRAEFFDLETARRKVNAAQVGLIDELEMKLSGKVTAQ